MSWVSEAGTEKAWLHQRRTDVEHNLQHAVKRSREETLTAAEIASAGCWTEGMQVEVDKQVAKATVKKAIACEDDLLLPDERDANLLAPVGAMRAKRAKVDRERENTANRLAHNNQVRAAVNMQGWSVHVDQATVTDALSSQIALQQLIKRPDMSVQVELFIQNDPAHPGQRVQWVAALTGALIAVPEFLCTRGKSGACVAYAPAAIAQRRKVWLSEAFTEAHARIAAFVQAAAGLPASQWTVVSTRDDFVAAVAHGGFGKIALVTLAEKEAHFKAMKNVFTINTFLPWRTATGLSDRVGAVGDCGL